MNEGTAAVVAYDLEDESYAVVDCHILVVNVDKAGIHLEVILYEDAVVEVLVSDLIDSKELDEAAVINLLRLVELEPARVMKVNFPVFPACGHA